MSSWSLNPHSLLTRGEGKESGVTLASSATVIFNELGKLTAPGREGIKYTCT